MKTKLLAILFCTIVSYAKVNAQTMVVLELNYNIGYMQYSALCVFNNAANKGNVRANGKCHVVTNVGHCWYDAHYIDHGSYLTIAITNPYWTGWLPAMVYMSEYDSYIEVSGIRYQVSANFVPSQYWQDVLSRYGFPLTDYEQMDVSTSYYESIGYEEEEDSENSSNNSNILIIVCVIIGVVILLKIMKSKQSK